jgi:carboxymethylenebutenolidase
VSTVGSTGKHLELSATSYVAEPAVEPSAAVIVVHDWFGLLDHVRRACDSLAGAGFLAVAPDLYDGRATTDPAKAERLLGELDEPAAIQVVRSLVPTLRTHHGGRRVGAVGFSVGGYIVLSVADTGLDAAVTYYGYPKDVARIRCPVLGHFAEHDEWPVTAHPGGHVDEYFLELRARGVEARYHVYPGTEHSFANEDVEAFAPAAAAQAWERTVAFLADLACSEASQDSSRIGE